MVTWARKARKSTPVINTSLPPLRGTEKALESGKGFRQPAIFPIGGAGRAATQRGATRAKSKIAVAPKNRNVL